MAAISFDTLKYVRKLVSAGVPQDQAEGQAEAMAEVFGYHVENLVTRDYLDARLDQRFAEQDRQIDRQFAEIRSELRLHRWILGAIAASTVLPALNALFGWI